MVKNKFIIGLLLIIILTFESCESSSVNRDSIQELVSEANKYEQAGNYDKALMLINKSVLIDSTISNLFVIRGKLYNLLYNEHAAIKDFSKSIQLNSKNIAAYFHKGISYSILEFYDSAIVNFNYALKLKTKGLLYFDEYGNEFSDIRDPIDVNVSTIKYFRGQAFYHSERNDLAFRDFRDSFNSGYKPADCQFYLGVILLQKGSNLEGCDYLKKSFASGYYEAEQYLNLYCK